MAGNLAQGLDARVELILSTGYWLARLGSKHKNRGKTNKYTYDEPNHAIFNESTNDLNLRNTKFMS